MEEWIGKLVEVGGDGEISNLDERKDLANFISTWKPLLDFSEKLKEIKSWFGDLISII